MVADVLRELTMYQKGSGDTQVITKVTKETDRDTECPICLDHVSGGDVIRCSVCTTSLHADCVRRWSGVTCPVCRTGDLTATEITKKRLLHCLCILALVWPGSQTPSSVEEQD